MLGILTGAVQICGKMPMPVINILTVSSLLNSAEMCLKTSSYFNVEFSVFKIMGNVLFWLFRVEQIQIQDTEHLFMAD